MCGRYTLTKTPEEIRRVIPFQMDATPYRPRYNIAPSQLAPVVFHPGQWALMRWGLVPSWTKDDSAGPGWINARAETAHSKPAFRHLLERRRCLVPADGFYEWRKTDKAKQPYYFRLADHALFAMAGLWDAWRDSAGEELRTFTILTTDANACVAPVHHRMPVMLRREDFDGWLDQGVYAPEKLAGMLKPYAAESMSAQAVSPWVNSPKHDGPECLEPVVAAASAGSLAQGHLFPEGEDEAGARRRGR